MSQANFNAQDLEIPLPDEIQSLIEALAKAPDDTQVPVQDVKKSIIGLMSVIGVLQTRLEQSEIHLSYLTSYVNEGLSELGLESLNQWAERVEKFDQNTQNPDYKVKRKSGIITSI